MATDMSSEELYRQLRRLVVLEPKQARSSIVSLFIGGSAALPDVLARASRPGEGRMRQMIAMAAKLSQSANVIEPILRAWQAVEPDEFTRRAITSALDSIRPRAPATTRIFEMPEQFVAAYRYASERLCHRVRNPLTKSASLLLRLKQCANNTSDAELRSYLTALYSDLHSLVQRVGSVVEFDIDTAYSDWRYVKLGEWLKASTQHFASRFGPATLLVRGSAEANAASVCANAFLLETIFGNVWANAVQASEERNANGCQITAELTLATSHLEVLVFDEGPGFSERQLETAFRVPFSTKAEERGRGLLEIAEAVGRLQGDVRLIKVAPAEYRMLIRLPIDNP